MLRSMQVTFDIPSQETFPGSQAGGPVPPDHFTGTAKGTAASRGIYDEARLHVITVLAVHISDA